VAVSLADTRARVRRAAAAGARPVLRDPRGRRESRRSVAGLDAAGALVACLVPETANEGVSPLSDCR